MSLRKLLFALIALTAIASQAQSNEQNPKFNIIPQPVEIAVVGSDTVAITYGTALKVGDASVQPSAQYLTDYAMRYLGIPLTVQSPAIGKKGKKRASTPSINPSITLINLNNGKVSGGYRMTVRSSEGIRIEGNDAAGVFYGVQTLIQLLPTRAGVIPHIPALDITDYPRFGFRGMHLDVVRHFFPVDYVKRYIDYLALHKLNFFHWHLTDDQGWRIEMKSHPELTQIGSYREGEIEGIFPGKYKPMPYQGYYTQEQIREVVAYAAARYVTVIPEIDIPGHCMAVLATHPQFSTTPNEPKACAKTWGIYNRQNNVLAPKPEVFAFLNDVFSELCDIFPGQYIHVGGDECAKRWWHDSQETQQYMRDNNIADEKALQSHFIHFVQGVVNKKGKTLIGWDEILEGGISTNCVVMNWRRPTQGIESLKSGHRTVMCNNRWSYLNQRESLTQQELGSSGPLSLKRVYEYQLIPDGLTAEEEKLIWGAEGCIWTEYIATPWKVEFYLFPRLSAVAERVWSPAEKTVWDDFAKKIPTQFDRYDLWGVRYNDAFFRQQDIPHIR